MTKNFTPETCHSDAGGIYTNFNFLTDGYELIPAEQVLFSFLSSEFCVSCPEFWDFKF
jgi:hypothetical protein